MMLKGQNHHHFKDHNNEGRVFVIRTLMAFILVVIAVGLLLARYYNLQVVNHQGYLSQSDKNRIQVRPKAPNRGLIFDAKGRVVAENLPSFTAAIIKEQVDDLDQLIDVLSGIINVEDGHRQRFKKALKQRRRPFQAVPIRYRLTEQEIALLAVNKYRLPGVVVDGLLVRHYPYGDLLAHSVGYVGRINERELNKFSEEEHSQYAGTYVIGKVGLEKEYEKRLLGEVGNEFIETNALGRVIQVIDQERPEAGENLHLHLDVDVQKAAQAAFEGRRGAIVAIDVNTGGVLAIYSAPSYNPNLFVTGISFKNYKALNESLDLPLFNRALQGQYPPGSTLKPMLGLGGLELGIITPEYAIKDPGFYQLKNDERLYREWLRGGHRDPVDLHKAIVESCDVYFYDMAFRMGVDNMHPFGEVFGLGKKLGIDLPSERTGLWPSRQWKRDTRGLAWYPGNSLNMSIGQGDVLATPLQLAVMTATLATRGQRFQPQLVQAINNAPLDVKPEQSVDVKPENWDYVIDAMVGVVNEPRGTARRIAKGAKYPIAGKTGTAQVVGIAQNERYDSESLAERLRDHGLFIGFSPVENPEIAIAVVVENGEAGGGVAAPVARKVFDAYFDAKQTPALSFGVDSEPR